MKKEILALCVLVLSSAGNASAHIPNVLPHDTAVNHPVSLPAPIEKSAGFYAAIECPGDVDAYGFSLGSDAFDPSNRLTGISGVVSDLVVIAPNGKPGRLLHVGSLVPGCQVYATVLPTVAVVGPVQDALPAYDGSVVLPAAIEIKAGQGVIFLQNQEQGPLWNEPFSYKSYFDQNSADIILTEQGEYRIYVWEASGRVGDYVLETGQIEVFGVPEIMQTLFWVTYVIYDREISNGICREQLKELDGRNPNVLKVIADYERMFGN